MMKDKPRLLFCSYGNNIPYDPLFLNRLADEFEAYLVTFSPREQIAHSDAKEVVLSDFLRPFRHSRINNLRIVLSIPWRAIQVRRCVRAMKPQIIVANWVPTYGLYAKLSKRRPFILFAYGSDIVDDPPRSPIHRAITVNVVKSADLVLIDCEVQRRALLSLGCLPEKIISFPWFNEQGIVSIDADSTLRDRLGWNRNLIVVCVRSHEALYSVDTLVRAVPQVVLQAPDVRFLIFGRGSQTHRLVELTHELNVMEFVHFAGSTPRDKLLGYMKDSDIYVSTSLSDGTSSSLLEAMFIGVPTVVTSIDANKEWVREGIDGLMFPVLDANQLAEAIVHLAQNPFRRRELSDAARKSVSQRVNWKSSSAELVNRMRSLVNQTS